MDEFAGNMVNMVNGKHHLGEQPTVRSVMLFGVMDEFAGNITLVSNQQ